MESRIVHTEGMRGGRETGYNIDRISVTADSIYPLLMGLLLRGFNFDSRWCFAIKITRRDLCTSMAAPIKSKVVCDYSLNKKTISIIYSPEMKLLPYDRSFEYFANV